MGNHPPIKQAPYRSSNAHIKWIDAKIGRLMKAGTIRASTSPWASPIVVVPKKGALPGEFEPRLCIDYRKLNAITVKDAYPIPRIDDLIDQLKDAQHFSLIDLYAGYHQFWLSKDAIPKTAFVTQRGHYEYVKMPFGLCNAPATFQNAVNTIFADLLGKGVVVYIDDINIYSKTWKEHLRLLEEVFRRLRANGLYIKPRKCHFRTKQMEFLGYVIDKNGARPNSQTVEAVAKFPTPTDKTGIRSFLGLAGFYRKFIKGFSLIAGPLYHLTKDNVPYEWTEQQEKTFKTLKRKLCIAPILV